MRRSARIALLMSLLLVVSCGQTGPRLVPVTGRVMYDGKPLTSMMVNFTPTGETQGNGGIAATDEDGRFTLISVRNEPGIPVGEYKVSFYPATPAPPKKDDPTDVVAAPRRSNVPTAFLNANESPLRVAVPENGGFVTITVTPSGKESKAEFGPKE